MLLIFDSIFFFSILPAEKRETRDLWMCFRQNFINKSGCLMNFGFKYHENESIFLTCLVFSHLLLILSLILNIICMYYRFLFLNWISSCWIWFALLSQLLAIVCYHFFFESITLEEWKNFQVHFFKTEICYSWSYVLLVCWFWIFMWWMKCIFTFFRMYLWKFKNFIGRISWK